MTLPIHTTGGDFVGGAPGVDGVIRNIAVSPVSLGGVVYSFEHAGVTDDQEHIILVTLDGDLIDILPDGALEGSFNISDTDEHALTLTPHRAYARPIPDLHGDFLGSRAYLNWTPSTSTDAAAYVVQWDAGNGSPMEDLATVTAIEIESRYQALPDSGTGTGALSIGGQWSGSTINEAATLTIGAAGRLDYVIGSDSGSIDFSGGEAFALPGGVSVQVHDEAAEYDVSDSWTFQVGPASHFLTGSLDDGTYEFTVLAQDVAGNQSSALTAISIVIAKPPSPVTASSISYDLDTDTLSLAWTDPADGDLADILVYSNYSSTFGDLLDYIVEEEPLATVSAGVESYSISSPIDGAFRFYIRSRDTSGRINPSTQALQLTLPSPTTSLALAEPSIIAVTPAPGGTFDITWVCDLGKGTDVDGFKLYANSSPSSPVFTSPVATLDLSTATGYPITSVTYRTGVYVGTTYFTVRATAGSETTQNTTLTSGIPDAVAPNLSDPLQGTPS